jgi:branched-chain amino acid transport system substrate-binding protein
MDEEIKQDKTSDGGNPSEGEEDKEEDRQRIEDHNKEKKTLFTGRIFSGLAVFLIVVVIVLQSYFFSSSNGKVLYIAVSGPMTGKSKVNGDAMVKGIQLYLDQINLKGGIFGYPVKLLIFDDQNQPELAKKAANEIAQNSQALAVIGHYTSSASIEAAPIYQKYGIPAVSGSATADDVTRDNDWYFRTIFNNSDQGALLANYVRKVLNYEDVSILFDEDVYGSELAAIFAQNAKTIGLKVQHRWHFNSNSEDSFNNSLDNLIETMKASPEKKILFLATHSTEAVETIKALRQLDNVHIDIIGADALSSTNFLKKFQRYPQEQIQPGYYSDGVYTTASLLFDIADERAQDFQHAFSKKYFDEPMATSATYYDATKVVVEAIRKMLEQGQAATLFETRRQIQEGLWQLATVDNAVEGVTGSLYFDEQGDVIKSIPMGIYKHGRAVTAMRQFQPLQNVQNRDNLLQDVLENRIIEVNGKFMNLAQVVYVGLDFTDIGELNPKNSTFTAEFYLWFRFQSEFDDSNIKFVNLFDPTNKPLSEPISVWHSQDEAGLTTKTYQARAQFKVEFDFHNYPLDQLVLPIYIRHKELTKNQLIYVVDRLGMNLAQYDSQSASTTDRKFFSIGGWYINKVSFFQNTQTNDSTWGITDFFNAKQRIEYSQFNATITISRHVLNFILKTLLPVIFVVVVGYISFFINSFSSKLGIGTNLILATSLFHLKLSSDLPEINYIVLIEYFFYLVYLLAIFIIMIAIFTHHHEEEKSKDSEKFINRLNFIGKIVYPLILLIFVGVIAYQNYHLIAW